MSESNASNNNVTDGQNSDINFLFMLVGSLMLILGIFLPIENNETLGQLSAFAMRDESPFILRMSLLLGGAGLALTYFRNPIGVYLIAIVSFFGIFYSLLGFPSNGTSWGWTVLFLSNILLFIGSARQSPPFILQLVNRRLIFGFVTLFVISILTFLGTELLPGDVAQTILGQMATPENTAALRAELGLDKPPLTRYVNWLGGIVQGDLGTALSSRRPINEMIAGRLQNTLFLAAVSALIAIPLAILLGLISVRFRDSWLDKFISVSTLTTISLPDFFVGYVLILIFAINLGWATSMSTVYDSMGLGEKLGAIALPATTLTLVVLAYMMRMTRAAIIGIMSSPYIEMANLKGVSPMNVIFRHALPNSIAPIVNVIALNLAYLVVGVVVVEVIFVYPGLGQLLVDHVSKRDIPVVQACALIFAAIYIGLNMLADIIAIISNPRLRFPK